jgi:Pentapeptide repeats (9 copies)
MSFTRIDLLPRFDSQRRQQVRERWETDAGRELFERIISLIRQGAGEDFLQCSFENGDLGFLSDYWDLAGVHIFGEDIVFPKGDNFEKIDFSYGQFWHSTFTSACFPETHFSFARFYNMTFKNCIFALAYFYGCDIEKCSFENCSFIEGNGFTNCDIKETVISDCFFSENMFKSCRFDENVQIVNATKPLILGLRPRASNFDEELKQNHITGIYRGIKDGYLAGEIFNQAQQYLFLQHQAYTRFNSTRKTGRYLWEGIAGYGLRPLRVLGVIWLLLGLVFMWFHWRLENAKDALVLSAGAIFTFGAKAELLGTLPLFDQVIYIVSAFLGVSLVALFVTVLANVLLKDN